MTPNRFVEALTKIRMESVFNPYSERCPHCDLEDAASIRRGNLLMLLKVISKKKVHSIWVGRDLGYRGGRRTGIPLTDEANLTKVSEVFGVKLLQATSGPPQSERTATLIWQVLRFVPKSVFFWNVFPLHPFTPGEPFSNRCHTREEGEKCQQFLVQLLDMLQPKLIVTIGRDAEAALNELKISFKPVRHPSYGGQSEFVEGIERLYGVSVNTKNLSLLQGTNELGTILTAPLSPSSST
jgi:uracil-DNA glycosylase